MSRFVALAKDVVRRPAVSQNVPLCPTRKRCYPSATAAHAAELPLKRRRTSHFPHPPALVPVPASVRQRIPASETPRPRGTGGTARPDAKGRRMFGTLAAAAALSLTPAQAGALSLTNVRPTYGELGAVRSANRYVPRDRYPLSLETEAL